MRNLVILALLFIFPGCNNDPYTFKILPQGKIKHQLIVVARTSSGIKAKGFAEATPAGTQVYFEVGRDSANTTSKPDGSFDLELPAQNGEERGQFVFDDSIEQVYEIRSLPQALNKVAKTPFYLSLSGQELAVDDIAVLPNKALLLSSTASLICPVNLEQRWVLDNKNAKSILLNPEAKENLMPRSIAGSGDLAIISLQKNHELALIDLKSGQIVEKGRLRDKSGKVYKFDLDNGSKSYADTPEEILALGDNLFVASFANYYQYADPSSGQKAILGPGLIALLSTDDSTIKTKDIFKLPYKNPIFITKGAKDQIIISCTGVYENIDSGKLTSKDAGVVYLKFSKNNLELIKEIPLKAFVPAKPAWHENTLLVPEAYGPRLAIINDKYKIAKRKQNDKWQFVLASHWHSDIFFLADNSGLLIAYSLKDGFLPFPFTYPIALNGESKMPISPYKVLFRHKESGPSLNHSYPPGFSAWVVSQLQSKVVPLDFLEIFGP